MGFRNLRLVMAEWDPHPARKTAYGSHDVLYDLEVLGSLEAAVADCDLIIGTSAKERKLRHHPIPAAELFEWIKPKLKSVSRIAIVFGSEENGLSNELLQQCHVLSYIPMSQAYPSLNLAQSVLIYAYELSRLDFKKMESVVPDSGKAEFGVLMESVRQFTAELDMQRQPGLRQQLLDRLAYLDDQDIGILLALMRYLRHWKEKK